MDDFDFCAPIFFIAAISVALLVGGCSPERSVDESPNKQSLLRRSARPQPVKRASEQGAVRVFKSQRRRVQLLELYTSEGCSIRIATPAPSRSPPSSRTPPDMRWLPECLGPASKLRFRPPAAGSREATAQVRRRRERDTQVLLRSPS